MLSIWKNIKFKKDSIFFRKLRLLNEAYGAYRWHILLIGILGIVASFVESIGITTVVPVFSFVSGEGEILGNNSISQMLYLLFDFLHIEYRFRYLLIIICFVFIFRYIFTLLAKYVSISISTKYEEKIRKDLFSKTINTDWSYLLKQKLGHLENVLMIDAADSRVLFEKIADILVIIGSLTVYIFVALNISSLITLITLVFGTVVFACLYPLVKKTQVTSRERVIFKKKIAHQVNQQTLGLKTVKSMDLSWQISHFIGGYFTQHRRLQIKLFLLHQVSAGFLEPLALIYILGIFSYSYLQSNFNMGMFVVLVFLTYRIFQYVFKLNSSAHLVNEKIEHLKYVLEYLRKADKHKERAEGNNSFSFSNEITFKDVSFFYPGRPEILSRMNISIAKGEMWGIIGPSGSGKTTIADLLLRLFKPTSGAIMVDGQDIQSVSLSAWRHAIGYLSQDIFLINDTVKNNISFYDENVSEEDVIRAAKMAHIYDVIMQLSGGFDTVIGERGIELSVGERQRVAIARVLARNPKILILDEATSALDNESEKVVQSVIEKFHKELTIIMIAHRLTTVMSCDKILAVRDGKIIESGATGELLKNSESYFYKSYHLKD